MIKLLLITSAALLLASCEHVNISYTPKGGLVVYPKAIQLIDPAK